MQLKVMRILQDILSRLILEAFLTRRQQRREFVFESEGK